MATTMPSELDRVMTNPDHVIISDDLASQLDGVELDTLLIDTQLLEIDGAAFVASLVRAERVDAIDNTWKISVSVPGLTFDTIAVAQHFEFQYNNLRLAGTEIVDFVLEGTDRFITLGLKRILTEDE